MADIDQDPRVAHLLTTAGHEATRFIHPEGVQAVRTTVRRRRRNRAIGAGVLAALVLIGGPIAALGRTGSHTTPAGTVTSGPTPSPSPSSSPPPPAAPDGKISAGTLRNATLTIPAWPAKGFDTSCPSGKVHLSGILKLEGNPVYEDVDQDGAQETVAVVSCNPQGSDYKVLAFDRDAAGRVVTLGQVVASSGTAGKPGDILTVWGVEAGDTGQVRVDVGDYRPCCDEAQASQHQWRTYGWNGSAFTQTGGPTSFGPNPKVTDLSVTGKRLTMIRRADGTWHGILTVTVHNAAAYVTPGRVRLMVGVPGTWTATASGCTLSPDGTQPIECTLPALAKRAGRTVTLTFTAPAGSLDTLCQLWVASVNPDGAGYPDAHPDKGPTTMPVTEA
jgi:hypothetical protein